MTEPAAIDLGNLIAFYMHQQRYLRGVPTSGIPPSHRRQLTMELSALFQRILLLQRIDFACEVGAHEASFSRIIKRRIPEARVIAFEANPAVFELHCKKLQSLGIEYYACGVADRPGTSRMSVPVTRLGIRHRMGSTLDFVAASESEVFDCEMISLNDFLSDFAFSRGALWVDVEGAASLVFRGANRILQNCVAIYVELEDRAMWSGQEIDSDVYRYLLDFGFVPVAADMQKSWQYNVMLVKQELLHSQPVKRAILSFLKKTAASWQQSEPDLSGDQGESTPAAS